MVQTSRAPPNTGPCAASVRYRQSPSASRVCHVPLHSGVIFPLISELEQNLTRSATSNAELC